MSRIKLENLEYYISVVNNINKVAEIKLYRANGTNYITKVNGNETVFQGTISECYYFVLGLSRLM